LSIAYQAVSNELPSSLIIYQTHNQTVH